jgi:hypothetical protein
VFGTVTLSSFASGAMLSGPGWIVVQIAVMPFVVIAGLAVLWWRHLFIRTIGIARARTKIGLANLVSNMQRMVWLIDQSAPP